MSARLTEYRDRVAIITGASSGIGEAIARELASRGAKVALVARRADRLSALATEIGERASVFACDVTDRGQVEATVRGIAERFGKIDILVNNAGYARHLLFLDESIEEIERLFRTNYLGTIYFLNAVLPLLRRQGEGFVVNVSSFAGKIGQPDEAAYSASKAAVTALSEALVHELRPHGIHVLCVHPVLVRTEMFTDDVMARMPRGMEKRFVEPSVLAKEVVRALAQGEHDITVPRSYSGIYLLRSLFPKLMSRKMGAVKMERVSQPKQIQSR